MDSLFDTYLPDIMHNIAQILLVPTIIILLLLIVVGLFFIGQIIAEAITERRHYLKNRAELINDLNNAAYEDVTTIIDNSQLLLYQKSSLLVVARNMGLPEEALFSLAQMEIGRCEKRYKSRLAWPETMSKVSPMLGLMGTLIPLGPGIVAMGQGNIETLSQSLLVAFDATVCGLVVAIVSLVISKIRSGWYSEYISTLESVMGCLLEKADEARKNNISLPTNYTGDPVAEFKAAKQSLREEQKGRLQQAQPQQFGTYGKNAVAENAYGEKVDADATQVLDAGTDTDATQVLDADRTRPLDASNDATQVLDAGTDATQVLDASNAAGGGKPEVSNDEV